jgi:hypothetical protein
VGEACDVLGGLLRDSPRLLDDRALTELAHRLAAVGGGTLRVRVDRERAAFHDVLQRYFTDDGHGDGLPRPELMQLAKSGPQRDESWRGLPWVLPALSPLMAGKRELRGKFEALLTEYEVEARTPLWEREGPGVDREIEALARSPLNWLHYHPLLILMPALDHITCISELGQQSQDATLVAIALELYHRRHGDYPATLDALVPQFLPQVPPDRYDGKPIKYRIVDGRPLLYSVGVDRKDDGGRLPNPRTLKPDAPHRKLQANWGAAQWQPPPPAGQPARERFPYADGDWILWPPVE